MPFTYRKMRLATEGCQMDGCRKRGNYEVSLNTWPAGFLCRTCMEDWEGWYQGALGEQASGAGNGPAGIEARSEPAPRAHPNAVNHPDRLPVSGKEPARVTAYERRKVTA